MQRDVGYTARGWAADVGLEQWEDNKGRLRPHADGEEGDERGMEQRRILGSTVNEKRRLDGGENAEGCR